MTGPEAGITRDAIELDFEFKGHSYKLVDTAGMRRRARVADKVEKLMVDDALRAIQFAHLCVLLVDATEPIHKQDLAIARLIEDEGRAIVIGANKWDAVRDRKAANNKYQIGCKPRWRNCAVYQWCIFRVFIKKGCQSC